MLEIRNRQAIAELAGTIKVLALDDKLYDPRRIAELCDAIATFAYEDAYDDPVIASIATPTMRAPIKAVRRPSLGVQGGFATTRSTASCGPESGP